MEKPLVLKKLRLLPGTNSVSLSGRLQGMNTPRAIEKGERSSI